MSKTLSEISPGSIVWFNTTLSGSDKTAPFIVLGPSKQGNSILLLQKYLYESRKFNSTNVSEYSTSDIDKYLSAEATESDSYRSKLPEEIRKCLVKTTIDSYSHSGKTTLSLARDIFLMSFTEAGFDNKTIEGISYLDALKIAMGTTVDSNARRASNGWWPRSCGENNMAIIDFDGKINTNWPATTSSFYVRPLLSVSPATLVDDSSSTLSLTPTGSASHDIDMTISMGQSTKRPVKAKASVNMKHADGKTIYITNNYKDTNPVWVTCDSQGLATLTNTTKTTDQWELGMRICTVSATTGTVIQEPALIVITE